MLDLNITLLFQFANFVVALVVLNWLLIKPVREIIKKRNDLLDGMASEADDFHAQADAQLRAYEDELAKARKQAGMTRDDGKSAALAEMEAIVARAQQSARQLLDANRKALTVQAEIALSDLRSGIDGFSTKISQKLMG